MHNKTNTRYLILQVFSLVVLVVTVASGQSVKGSGTPGAIPAWTDSNTLGNSPLTRSANDVAAAGNLSVAGTFNAPTVSATTVSAPTVIAGRVNATTMTTQSWLNLSSNSASIALENTPFVHGFGRFNVFVGPNAGNFTLTGTGNAALGSSALLHLGYGGNNTALGANTLAANISGNGNTAVGAFASENTTGNQNTAVGFAALSTLTSGFGNIALGVFAGFNSPSGDNNIYIGNAGASESDTIRIGTGQSATYIGGISGTSLVGVPVVVNEIGRLGITGSSARFKQDIQDMGQASAALMSLRPVMFRYKPEYADGNAELHYGLVAEEVAKVYPNLVQNDKNGEPFTVLYQELPALLLNEIQRQQRRIESLQSRIEQQQRELESEQSSYQAQLANASARLAALERQNHSAIQ